ncbi:MAG TPA: secretin N-terminal domain-containing protein [Methyloversatilis sp.]
MLVRTFFFLLLLPFASWAQTKLDIIPLQHRTPEQILPALKPLVGGDAALSGANNRIFIRADAATRAAVKQAIEAMDTPLRSLMISVRQDNDDTVGRDGAAVSGSIGAGGVSVTLPDDGDDGVAVERRNGALRPGARVWSTRGNANDRLSQRVQVVEGGAAFIQIGSSVPIPFSQIVVGPGGGAVTQGTEYRDIGSGFYALPRVNGDRVTLDISPQKESLSDTQYGEIRSARLISTVRGRIGEWIELGASGYDEQVTRRGVTRYGTRDVQEQRRVWVRVDIVQ